MFYHLSLTTIYHNEAQKIFRAIPFIHRFDFMHAATCMFAYFVMPAHLF